MKIAHKVAKSKYFVDILNESDSSINSLFNDIVFVGVSFVLQNLSVWDGGGRGAPAPPPSLILQKCVCYNPRTCQSECTKISNLLAV